MVRKRHGCIIHPKPRFTAREISAAERFESLNEKCSQHWHAPVSQQLLRRHWVCKRYKTGAMCSISILPRHCHFRALVEPWPRKEQAQADTNATWATAEHKLGAERNKGRRREGGRPVATTVLSVSSSNARCMCVAARRQEGTMKMTPASAVPGTTLIWHLHGCARPQTSQQRWPELRFQTMSNLGVVATNHGECIGYTSRRSASHERPSSPARGRSDPNAHGMSGVLADND